MKKEPLEFIIWFLSKIHCALFCSWYLQSKWLSLKLQTTLIYEERAKISYQGIVWNFRRTTLIYKATISYGGIVFH